MAISRKNSEQYPDPTAFMAMTAVEKAERSQYRKRQRKRNRAKRRMYNVRLRSEDAENDHYEQTTSKPAT